MTEGIVFYLECFSEITSTSHRQHSQTPKTGENISRNSPQHIFIQFEVLQICQTRERKRLNVCNLISSEVQNLQLTHMLQRVSLHFRDEVSIEIEMCRAGGYSIRNVSEEVIRAVNCGSGTFTFCRTTVYNRHCDHRYQIDDGEIP